MESMTSAYLSARQHKMGTCVCVCVCVPKRMWAAAGAHGKKGSGDCTYMGVFPLTSPSAFDFLVSEFTFLPSC